MSRVEIVLGPPGTGKTTTLLQLLTDYLESGGSPERVAFVSFSRRAIKEVVEKVGYDPEKFSHFRTIHSTAFHFLGLGRDDVMQPKHWRQLSETIGVPFSHAQFDESIWDGGTGDRCMALYNLARARGTSVEHEWRQAMLPDLSLRTVQDVVYRFERFKHVNALWDFHDMITKADGELPVDVLFVDEAQDTSQAQWTFLRKAAKNVPRVILAGDDDQTVYAWNGADGDALRRFAGSRRVLPQSYRIPLSVKKLADGLVSRITKRVPKVFQPRVDGTGALVQGAVTWRNDPSTLDLRAGGTWLLLARSNYQLESLRELARRQGVVYTLPDGTWSWSLPAVRAAITYERLRRGHEVPRADARTMAQFLPGNTPTLPRSVRWGHLFGESAMEVPWMDALPLMSPSDREYIRALRMGGESLVKPGRVRIGTVHSVKGAEADNVVLYTDVSTRVAHGARVDPDSEIRVQYVAVTRARERLHLILPQTPTHWTL